MYTSWSSLIRAYWPTLALGKKVWLDVDPNLHPKFDRAFRANVGWPDGQSCDYTIPYDDGSRIHAQCFGIQNRRLRIRLHRDRFDPDRNFMSFVMHGLTETPVGPLLLGALVVGGIGAASS
jgi:hypothetical protein